MESADRTTNGIKNTPLFYRGKLLIYVEGPDDASFWSNVFPNKVGNRTPKFKPVGGDINLEERVTILTDRNISEDQKNFIVARDSHYRKIAKKLSNDRKVIETEYHSIENIMLCKCMITKTIRGLSRKITYPESAVERWLNMYDERIYPIMVELLSNVVDKIFFGPTAEALRGLFGSFHQPCLRSQIRACRPSGFGWGVMTSEQPRRRRFHILSACPCWAGGDSSGDLLDTIYKLHTFNDLTEQLLAM